jgi:hypothetical protein
LEPQEFNLLGTDDLKAPLQEPPKASESENPKHNSNELIFLAAAAVTAVLWSLKERDGSAEIVEEDEQEQEEQEEMEDDAKLLFVDNDIAIDTALFAEAMVLITAAISTASKASKRICNNQEIWERCKSYGAQQNCNRDKRRRRSEQQRNEGLSCGISKACYFIYIFLIQIIFSIFGFRLPPILKQKML